MGFSLVQNSTSRPLPFLLVLSSDHITGATGKSPTVTISKAGGAFATPAGAVSEIANGWYQVVGNATDTNTLGPLLLEASASGCDPASDCFVVEVSGAILYGESGSVPFTYTVFDVNGTTPLSGVSVFISSDVAGTQRSQAKLSDALGQVTFTVDPSTVYVWRSRFDRTFTDPDTEVVA